MDTPKTRILVVDDEPAFTSMLRLNLEKTGQFAVREENDPTRAFQTAKLFRPDLILLDVMMPELEGGDVAQQIQADPDTRCIPIVFLTALVENDEAQVGGLVSGGRRFLPKPASVAEVLECISQVTGPVPRAEA